jgi:hypothetical protein
MTEAEKLNELADAASKKGGCDVLLFSGYIGRFDEDAVVKTCASRSLLRDRVLLLLATWGGSPDAAYRIARTLQERYKKVTVYVHGLCKSSGTLIVLGADELVMSEYAELGPLDIQVRKQDEVGEFGSGLTPLHALETLRARASDAFQEHFTKLRNEIEMTSKTAAEVATQLTVGLLGNVYSQIDPMKLAEMDRQVRIALEYGERLTAGQRRNVKDSTLAKLVSSYPSHGFVIDRAEAKELFRRVRPPSAEEIALAESIRQVTRWPKDGTSPIVEFLGSAQGPPAQEQAGEQETAGAGEPDTTAEVPPAGEGAQAAGTTPAAATDATVTPAN